MSTGLNALAKRSATCVVCGGATATLGRGSLAGGRLDRCGTCGHIRRSTTAERSSLSLAVAAEAREPSTPADWLLAHLPERIRVAEHAAILDVGCWDGRLLRSLPERWTKRGIEPNPLAAASARAAGIDVESTSLEAFADDGQRYDAVLMLDVLEHLPDPNQAIERVYSLLVPGGFFLALTGNGDSRAARIFGKAWYYYAYPEHVSVFTRESATSLMGSMAFEPVVITRVRHPMSDHAGDIVKVLERLWRRAGPATDRPETSAPVEGVGFGLPAFSRLVRGADHLWISARKRDTTHGAGRS